MFRPEVDADFRDAPPGQVEILSIIRSQDGNGIGNSVVLLLGPVLLAHGGRDELVLADAALS